MNRFIFYNNALRQFMKQKNTRYVWLVPRNITELYTYSLWNLPSFRKQGAKFLFKVHQSSLYPGIAPVYLVQPGHLSKKTTVIYVNVEHTPCLSDFLHPTTHMHAYTCKILNQKYKNIFTYLFYLYRIQNAVCTHFLFFTKQDQIFCQLKFDKPSQQILFDFRIQNINN